MHILVSVCQLRFLITRGRLWRARWLTYRNEDASKKIVVPTGILVFDFELFVGDRFFL
jgi:hypothetical protein